MTNTELKNQIDIALNNSVADNSITPASVATQIKSVVDYVDQESGNLYKKYRALLTQTSTNAPVATVLENTIGNIVWSRNSQGTFYATLTGVFMSNKTHYPTYGSTDGFNRVYIHRISDNVIQVKVMSEDFTTSLDNELFNFPIEILVYN